MLRALPFSASLDAQPFLSAVRSRILHTAQTHTGRYRQKERAQGQMEVCSWVHEAHAALIGAEAVAAAVVVAAVAIAVIIAVGPTLLLLLLTMPPTAGFAIAVFPFE